VWNTKATAEVEALGKEAQPMSVYAASKVYAEQSAWAWVKEHKPSWDFVAILPPYVWGPYIHHQVCRGSPFIQRGGDGLMAVIFALALTSGKETHW
jgi:nucleoside-diphosphate-sugar epimerase